MDTNLYGRKDPFICPCESVVILHILIKLGTAGHEEID